MKKLSIEEKAQAYDEVIKKVNDFYEGKTKLYSDVDKTLNYLFPELKESEGERIIYWIRKELEDKYVTDNIVNNETADKALAWLEKQGEQNPYSGVSFKYNGHTWGMCARDNGVEILIDGHLKGRVFTNDSNAKEMFIKALERVEEQNNKGYKLTDCDKISWWEDFKAYTSCTIVQKPADKVEPKFKVGDVIVEIKPNGSCQPVRVKYIGDGAYLCESDDGTRSLSFPIINQDDFELVEQESIWKPSGEQMKYLWKYAEQNNYDGSILTSLYNDLKKLKGRSYESKRTREDLYKWL